MAFKKFEIIELSQNEYLGMPEYGKTSNVWITINNVRALLKRNHTFRFCLTDDGLAEDVLEKLAYEIGNLLDIKCARIGLALENGCNCCLSYDFIKENEEFFTGIEVMDKNVPVKLNRCEHMINSVISGFEKMESYVLDNILEIKKANVKALKREFFKMVLFDCLLFNKDRHNTNWGVILNKETGDFKFATLFDHDLILLKEKCEKYNGFYVGNFNNLLEYVSCNYYSDTVEFVNKIKNGINEASILNILNKFDESRGIDKKYILDYIIQGKEMIVDKYSRIERLIMELNNNITEAYLNDNRLKEKG